MNEWELQDRLTRRWREQGYVFQGSTYQLVCWELMFPSWQINDNQRKWNEVSVDFVFYSQKQEKFLIVELKNRIRGRKELYSAFCQCTHRAILFKQQYSKEKISQAMRNCFTYAKIQRGQPQDVAIPSFSSSPVHQRVIMAKEYPKNSEHILKQLNTCSHKQIVTRINEYASNKEFDRFRELDSDDMGLLSSKLVAEQVIAYPK